MSKSTVTASLQMEREAFLNQLGDLSLEHSGEFALFLDKQPHGFFASYDDAYHAGLERFGLDVEFLIQRVEEATPVSVSIAWDEGVAFGEPG